MAFFTLSVFPLFFSSPHVIVFCINPFTSLRASRRLVCFFFFTFFNPHLKKKTINMFEKVAVLTLNSLTIQNSNPKNYLMIMQRFFIYIAIFFFKVWSKEEMMKANPLSSGLVIFLIFCLHCGAFSRFASFGIASAPKKAFLACKMETQHVGNDKPGAWWEIVTALACLYKNLRGRADLFLFCTPCYLVVWFCCHFFSFLDFSTSVSPTLFFTFYVVVIVQFCVLFLFYFLFIFYFFP